MQIDLCYIFPMTSRTHDMIAFASLLTVAVYNPPESHNIATTVSCLIGCTVGSLIPDLDQATNRLWDLLPVGNFVGKILRNLMLQHRTISHSLVGIFFLYQLLMWLTPKILNPSYINANLVVASIMIGVISHIAADMLTKEGVPLFFPFPFKIGFPPFEFLRITTGKFFEKAIIFPGIILYLIWFVGTYHGQLLTLVKSIQN